jgi:hypothetical protein
MTPLEWLFILGGGGYLAYSVGKGTGASNQLQSSEVFGEIGNIQHYVTQAGGISAASKTILLDNLSQLETMLEGSGTSSVQPVVSSGGSGGVVITVPVNQSGAPSGSSTVGSSTGTGGTTGLGNLGGGTGSSGSGLLDNNGDDSGDDGDDSGDDGIGNDDDFSG